MQEYFSITFRPRDAALRFAEEVVPHAPGESRDAVDGLVSKRVVPDHSPPSDTAFSDLELGLHQGNRLGAGRKEVREQIGRAHV